MAGYTSEWTCCSICLRMYTKSKILRCAHPFCYTCLSSKEEKTIKCPQCGRKHKTPKSVSKKQSVSDSADKQSTQESEGACAETRRSDSRKSVTLLGPGSESNNKANQMDSASPTRDSTVETECSEKENDNIIECNGNATPVPEVGENKESQAELSATAIDGDGHYICKCVKHSSASISSPKVNGQYKQDLLPTKVNYEDKNRLFSEASESVMNGEKLMNPLGCAYHVSRGEIFVADTKRIVVCDSDGSNGRVFYTDEGSNLTDVAVSTDGQYVFAVVAGAFIKLDIRGNVVKNISGRSWSAIACYENRTFVVDYKQACVLVFDEDDNEIQTIGEEILEKPFSIAVSKNGEVYVTDVDGVHVFRRDGEYQGKAGVSEGISDIHELALDGDGNVCVSRPFSNCVDVYTSEGELVTRIKIEGESKGFFFPWGLCFTPEGKIIVTDREHERLRIF